MFVVYFGRKEADAEEARMRSRRRRYESGAVTIDVPKTHPGRPWDWNWRGSFRSAVATEWRWVAGRCERAVCLSMDDGSADDGSNREPAGIVGVALRNGRGFTASGDGRCRCWDAKSGEAIATWPSPSRFEPSPGFEPSSRFEPSSSPSQIDTNPATCMAHGDGIVVVGHEKNGLIRGFDVDAGVETFTKRTPCASPVSALALGGGWCVAGTDGGAVVTMSAVDGADVVVVRARAGGSRLGDWEEIEGSNHGGGGTSGVSRARFFRANPSPRFERGVTACAVDPSGRFAAVAAGAEVVTWTVRDETFNEDGDDDRLNSRRRSFGDGLTRLVGHVETVRCMAFVPRPADGTCVRGSAVSSAVSSSHVPFLVTGGDDATIRIWDPVSGRCLRELEGPPGTAEAEHAGQTPVEWQYSPPPGVTCIDVWAGQIVEGRDDGSVLHWSGAFDGLRFDHELLDGSTQVPPNPNPVKPDGVGLTTRSRRHRPSAYRRWWVHAERVTAVLVRGGRVVSVGDDGECHVMALPEDALRRARATLAAEGRREAEYMRSIGKTSTREDADALISSEGAESLGSPPARNQTGINNSSNNSTNAASNGTSPSNWRPGGVNGYHRRLSSEFMNVAARCAHTAWRGGRGAASAVARSTEGLARRTEAAGMRLLESADALSGGVASAAAALANSQAAAASAAAFAAAAFAAAEAERVAAELSHLAIGQLYSGGEFRAIGGVRFREHKRSIGCVAADREMLVTGDEDGNVFVRDFEPAHLGN